MFRADAQYLPPALQSPLLGLHVGAYVLAYVILLKAGVQACAGLVARGPAGDGERVRCELGAYRLVRLGFPVLTLGLVLGALWGKRAWGDYWHWDPKELWSLAMWLVYLAYFQTRHIFGPRHTRLSLAVAVAGVVVIAVTLSWVNLARLFAGLHSYAV
jgi:ABC-type transport system involved in cytochrome c biogenesis permease subunit